MQIGILHPGAMGAPLAADAAAPGVWAGNGRSNETHTRAEANGLQDVGTIRELVRASDVVVSVCPPHAAVDVAAAVHAEGFDGVYVDANAVAPATAEVVGSHFERFVDGAIIGPPPIESGTTRLYLSGEEAEAVAALWAGSKVEVQVLAAPAPAASALKMAYAGWTKGSAALLLTMRAYAEAAGVGEELLAEWDRSLPGLLDKLTRTAGGVGPKAWRFSGEMQQIAAALEAEGLPPGFHQAADETYRRLAPLKGGSPTIADVLDRLAPPEQ